MIAASSRADLVRVLVALGPGVLPAVARMLGYDEVPAPEPESKAPESPPPSVSVPLGPLTSPEVPLGKIEESRARPVPFWRVEELELRDIEPDNPGLTLRAARALSPEELAGRPLEAVPAPRAEPLAPWSRLALDLEKRLATGAEWGVDLEALVDQFSRGAPVRRLPRRSRLRWPSELTVLVDRSLRLIPFWADQDTVRARLAAACGRQSVKVCLPEDLESPRASTAGPVLALSDLGAYGTSEDRRVWLWRARRLARAGRRLTALTPVPPARLPRTVGSAWRATPWERRARQATSTRPDRAALDARAERLLRLLSPAVAVEPALLRAARGLLPAFEADAGTEADVWSFAGVSGASSAALLLDPAAAAKRRADFAGEAPELQRRVAALLRAFHVPLPAEIWHEEALTLETIAPGAVSPQDLEAARIFVSRLPRTLAPGGALQSGQRAVARWFRQVEARVPTDLKDDPRLRGAMALTWALVHRDDRGAGVPKGVDPAELRALLGTEAPRLYEVRQVAGELCFAPAPSEPSRPTDAAQGSLVVVLAAAHPLLVAEVEGEELGVQARLDLSPALPLFPKTAVTLLTDHSRARLGVFQRPVWAARAGRDRFGLWVEFELGRVRNRLRWIPPGRFTMGSPPEEAGRLNSEGPTHEVVLTEGYWLGEVPCTQALWEAVMGKNPSRYKSADRPVDNVSWEDCRTFLSQLSERVPGLDARLPTEAEWERACRAGTKTSTYAGELEILGECNGPLLDQIAWYTGNSGVGYELKEGWDSSKWPNKQYEHARAGTRRVAQKQPNAWGLYDMLGNVLEWCSDYFGDYPSERQVDPVGPAGGSERVVRGGSWASDAGRVRSATRRWVGPGSRYVILGFRLARGQNGERSEEAAEPPKPVAPARRSRAGREPPQKP